MAKDRKSVGKLILTIATIAGMVILVISLHQQILGTIRNFRRIDLWILLLIIPIEAMNYHAQAKLYQLSMNALGAKFSYWYWYRVSLELNFVSTIFPSGGISGVSYFSVRLKPKGVSTAQSTLIQVMKFFLIFFAFQILLVFGMIFLAIGGRANEVVILVASSIITLLVILTGGTIFIVGDKHRIDTVFTFMTRFINRVIKFIFPKKDETINVEKVRKVFLELHGDYLLFRHNKQLLKWPLIYAILANLTEVAAIYVVYLAFGHWENPGAIILAYAVANFAGIMSILPAGIGIYEALMTLTLAASGISASLSLPITIMYRVVNTIIQNIPAFVLYQKNLRLTKS